MNNRSKRAEIVQMLSLISQLGIMMVVSIFGCFFIGRFIDDKLGTGPIFMLIFLVYEEWLLWTQIRYLNYVEKAW